MAPAARQLALSSRCPALRVWPRSPWLPCGVPFEGGQPEPMLRRLAPRGSALLYFVQLRLGAVTEGILCSWSAASSRVIQASALRRAWKLGAWRSYK